MIFGPVSHSGWT